jgi:hypothetical protein
VLARDDSWLGSSKIGTCCEMKCRGGPMQARQHTIKLTIALLGRQSAKGMLWPGARLSDVRIGPRSRRDEKRRQAVPKLHREN